MKLLRQFITGLFSASLGGAACWRGVQTGPWFLVVGGAVLVASGLLYCVRPGRRLLGLIEFVWGAQLLANFFVSGRGMSFSEPGDAGRSMAVVLGGLLVVMGLRNMLRSPRKPRPSPPAA